jgi:hypothetical protein
MHIPTDGDESAGRKWDDSTENIAPRQWVTYTDVRKLRAVLDAIVNDVNTIDDTRFSEFLDFPNLKKYDGDDVLMYIDILEKRGMQPDHPCIQMTYDVMELDRLDLNFRLIDKFVRTRM